MIILVYRMMLEDGSETFAVGQYDHPSHIDIDAIGESQPMEVPDGSSIDDIVKFVKMCDQKQDKLTH